MADAAAAIEEELEALEALYPDDGLVVEKLVLHCCKEATKPAGLDELVLADGYRRALQRMCAEAAVHTGRAVGEACLALRQCERRRQGST